MSALDVAERKGRQAFFDGKELNECLYPDRRGHHGQITYSRAFIRARERGWYRAPRGRKRRMRQP